MLNPFAGNLFGARVAGAGARVIGFDVVVALTVVVGDPVVLVAKNF